ncbi:MAG: DUF7312 domain-containing protein [Halolamina sp.]
MSESRDDDEWAVNLEDLAEDDEPERREPEPIEPGDPTAEGVVFVVLGIALTVVVLVGAV